MKLFYKPGACSLSPNIVLREAGLDFTLVKVDLISKVTEHGDNFLKINAKGLVPALLLDDGVLLTEGAVIVQFVADKVPERKLLAPTGNLERYQTLSWLNYISTELHRGFSPLFRPTTPEDYKSIMREEMTKKLRYVNEALEGKQWIMGQQFTVADGYLFTVLRWAYGIAMDMQGLDNIAAYMERMKARPTVAAALAAEGL